MPSLLWLQVELWRSAPSLDSVAPPQALSDRAIARRTIKCFCQVCGKGSRWPSEMERHMRVHTGEKPFACDMCSARFNQKVNMQMHRRTHLTSAPPGEHAANSN